jgi:hypothetical protein
MAFSLQFHNSPLYPSENIHAVRGGGWPRWQLLNVADAKPYLAERQSESVLAGGNGDGGTQLQPDDSGARLSAGGWLVAVTVKQFRFSTAMDSKLCDFVFVYSYFS